ncbi:MAG: DUF4239 domain-containing protein [Gammaproteobacteria bacterium]|nr:DUF4239 domain-containing protein [Gammaproteobacteria bacterium]
MDMYWIYDVPTWQLGLGIKVLFLAISLTGLVVTRNVISKYFHKSQEADQAVSAIFGAIGMLYGLLLGLVAVATWQNYDKIHELVDQESASIIQLYRCVSVLNDPAHEAILQDIMNYTKEVIQLEWPAQPIIYAEAVSAFSDLLKARRMRIDGGNLGIPKIFWMVIIGGAFLSIPILFFFNFPSFRTHFLLTGLYVFYLSGMVTLIAVLDNPLRGELSVSSEPFENALKVMANINQHQR